jgi:hypothetical protein
MSIPVDFGPGPGDGVEVSSTVRLPGPSGRFAEVTHPSGRRVSPAAGRD